MGLLTGSHFHVLVVGDDILAELVRPYAYQLEQTQSLARLISSDLAVVDASFLEVNYEFISAIRKGGYRPRILIVLDRYDVDVITRWLEAGADDYLIKPFTAEMLKKRINDLKANENALQLVSLFGMELKVHLTSIKGFADLLRLHPAKTQIGSP